MDENQSARIDKWLWMVRVFKTRSLATEACKKGRVSINDNEAKASKDLKIGDSVSVRKPPVTYSYIVKGLPKNRIGAKLVTNYAEDITSSDELAKLEKDIFAFQGYRDRGSGRPTKKERRDLDDIRNTDTNS